MQVSFFQLLLFGLAAAAANVLGGMILFPAGIDKNYKKLLKYLLALGAGFMLAVVFVEILPKSIEIWREIYPNSENGLMFPMMLVLVGYLITQFFEHTIAPHFHLGEELHQHEHLIKTSAAYTAVGGLMIHTFFDGVSIAAASQVEFSVGVLVFIAVFLHKFPEGFTIASMVLAAGKGRKEVFIRDFDHRSDNSVRRFIILFRRLKLRFYGRLRASVGERRNFICGGERSDSRSQSSRRKNPLVSFSVFAGVALFFGLHFLLHQFLEH